MRIIRIVHAGSVSLALSLPMIALGGGCDSGSGGGGTGTSAKETPEAAAARGKTIQDAYKTNPPDSAKKLEGTGKK